ncbi:MAG: FAD-dependent monooxygenase [Polyangiales bacterium]
MDSQTSAQRSAVVLGGSVAGLLAAHMLARHFDRVIIIERDHVAEFGAPRKGVPQGRILHGLLAGGRRALENMFPRFSEGLAAYGALDVDIGTSGDFYVGGRKLPEQETDLRCHSVSRPLLESYIRERVLADSRISVRQRWVGQKLVGDRHRVTGVHIAHADTGQTETLHADLVMDASGRGSQLPAWLQQLGAAAPAEERVRVDISYSSCFVRRRPGDLGGKQTFIINPHPTSRRAAAALAQEGDRFILAFTGYLDEPVPTTPSEAIAFARSLPTPELYELLRDAEFLSELSKLRLVASQRRRYERLSELPRGLLVCGDALCCFNPAYGQGMTVAALEAQALHDCLQAGEAQLGARYFRQVAKLIDVPWSIVVGGDFAFDGVEGKRPRGWRITNAYMSKLQAVAAEDREVSYAFLRVIHLVAPPSLLLSPRILWRVLKPRPVRRPREREPLLDAAERVL